MDATLFPELEVKEISKQPIIRNPYGRFERKSVKQIYDKEINSLRSTIKVLFANRESVHRQLRERDEEIIRLKKIISENGLKTN